MTPQLTTNDLSIIANLINRVSITGQEATTVAVLLQKINGILQSEVAKPNAQDFKMPEAGAEKK